MASLHELRKRLQSVRSTGQLAGAMRTAATAKYARLSKLRAEFSPYADACWTLLAMTGGVDFHPEPDRPGRECLVVLGNSRGLCGGFNAEFHRALAALLDERASDAAGPRGEDSGPPVLLAAGKRAAAFLRGRGAAFEEFALGDVPDYAQVQAIAARARALFDRGEVGAVTVMYQSFRNMLVQVPRHVRLLPPGEDAEGTAPGAAAVSPLFFPARESIAEGLFAQCVDASLYGLALENAAGAQAATIMAMRSACDNAEASAAALELTINRRRQAEVTSGVIETASGNS